MPPTEKFALRFSIDRVTCAASRSRGGRRGFALVGCEFLPSDPARQESAIANTGDRSVFSSAIAQLRGANDKLGFEVKHCEVRGICAAVDDAKSGRAPHICRLE